MSRFGLTDIRLLVADRREYRTGDEVSIRLRFMDERQAPVGDSDVVTVIRRQSDGTEQRAVHLILVGIVPRGIEPLVGAGPTEELERRAAQSRGDLSLGRAGPPARNAVPGRADQHVLAEPAEVGDDDSGTPDETDDVIHDVLVAPDVISPMASHPVKGH